VPLRGDLLPYNLSDIPGTEDLEESQETTGIKEGTRPGLRRTVMDNTYRLRFLIYFAAFMLVMSLCFVYAEPLPTHSISSAHLLFQTCPQQAGFLAPALTEPAFDPAALRAALPPTVSPAMMEQLELSAHPHHGLFHRSRHTAPYLAPGRPAGESSALGLSVPAATGAGSTR
jgi:hypothetical protein